MNIRTSRTVPVVLALMTAASGAIAQAPTLPTLAPADYTGAAAGFLSSVAPLVSGLLTFAAAAMAIKTGPRILKWMVRTFTS